MRKNAALKASYGMSLFLCLLQTPSINFAADIRVDPQTEILLEGQIEKGDYEKLLKIARDLYVYPGKIYLASPGGNLAEAMKIGRMIRRLRWATEVPETSLPPDLVQRIAQMHGLKDPAHNNVCASACFFVFVAGIFRYGDRLGIHRPYMSNADLRRLSGDQAIGASQGARAEVAGYLEKMGLPAKYAQMMYSVSKDQTLWLGHGDIKADLQGFIPELQDWVKAKCDKMSDSERAARDRLRGKPAEEWSSAEQKLVDLQIRKDLEMLRCWKDIQFEMRREGWRDVFGQK
jgi:hypothetical protein